jgi:hypothetical protein
MFGASKEWKRPIANSSPTDPGIKVCPRGVMSCQYHQLARPQEKHRNSSLEALLCNPPKRRVLEWLRYIENIMSEKQPITYRDEKTETYLVYSAHSGTWQPIGQRPPAIRIALKTYSHGLKSKECYKALKQKPKQIREKYTELQSSSKEYPPRLLADLAYLKGLTDGWGEGDELAPTKATVELALQIEHRIRRKMEEAGQKAVYPELVPGVRGQIELAYLTKTAKGLRKDLLIQVPRNPKADEILILRGVRNKRGEVADVQTVNMKPTGAIDPHVEWFLDSRLP